jgi:photosystem II stability/assembly factor-like uncharacterized protein
MLRHLRFVALAAVLVTLAFAAAPLADSQATGVVADEFEALHFRHIGPATMSGRITDFAVLESNPAVYYVGTAHGGVWKTTSNGTTFEGLFQDQGLISIGDVTMSQSNPELVWVGTGESNNRQSTSWGDGVYKSTDGGETWTNMGLRESRHVNRIVIDPEDNNTVFVAATGPLFGSGGDRGVYKTTDGGRTWKQVLQVDDDTGANDLVMAHGDRMTLYASTYQRRRSQCCMNGGGPGSGIWKSVDGGETWTRLEVGLPDGPKGRIALDVFRHSANIVYSLIEGESSPRGGGAGARGGFAAAAVAGVQVGGAQAGAARGAGAQPGRGGVNPSPTGLYRSDDGGASWRKVNNANPRPMYFSQVRIDPNNPDRVYLGGVGLHMTVDGGQSMATDAAQATHDDVHAIWINPANTDHLLIGHDGGVSVSYDMSRTWVQLPNLSLALFYHISYDMGWPYNVCGGLQDNYNWCGPSTGRFTRGIRNSDWFQVQGGDGFVVLVDRLNENIVFSESQNGNMRRGNMLTGEAKGIRPSRENVEEPTEAEFRYNWDAPMIFSPHEPGVLLVAANRVFKSNNKGDSWVMISGDLTTNADRSEIATMGVMNGDINIARNDGISSWPTLVSLAESPKQPGVYFTGSDDGVVSMSRDGGKTWENITARLPGFPAGAWVSEVVPSAHDANVVYVTVDAHRLNDYNTYMWTSTDAGRTFRSLNGNLGGEAVKTMTEDPKNPDVLYIGTETGLFLTLDRGQSWRRLKANLPTVRIDEIAVHSRDNALILGTHGRGAWILDDLAPVQEYAAAQAANAKLFSIPPFLQWRPMDNQNDEFWGHQFFVGENKPFDAVIRYHLKQAATDVKLRVSDASNRQILEITAPEPRRAAGIHALCWDMRVAPIETPGGDGGRGGFGRGGGGRGGGRGPGGGITDIPSPMPESGVNPTNPCSGQGGGGVTGPWVLPGTYNVALVVNGAVVESKPMRVVADPVMQMTDAQRRRYFDVASELHELQRRGMSVTSALNPFDKQMTDLAGKLGGMENVPADVKARFETLSKEHNAVRVKFGVPVPAGGGGGGGGRGGRGGGGGGDPANIVGRIGQVKSQILAFHEPPSEYLMRQHAAVRTELPRAIAEVNSMLANAAGVSQALKQHGVALTVPAPIR